MKSSPADSAPASREVGFGSAMDSWNSEYKQFSKFGWGPTTKAERWNGRHAMFGWVVICASAYAKGHNLIPEADLPLDLKAWGTLATISGKETITNERAVILIANVHALCLSVLATCAPLPFSDQLLLQPGEEDEAAYGAFPKFVGGLTKEAEIYNGRMAMMGIVAVIGASAIEHKSILEVVNEWIGGAYGNVA